MKRFLKSWILCWAIGLSFAIVPVLPAPATTESCKNLAQQTLDITQTGNGTGGGNAVFTISGITWEPDTRYTISVDVEPQGDITYSENGNLLYWSIDYTDGSHSYQGITTSNYTNGRISIKTPADKTISYIVLTPHQRWTGGTLRLSNLQVEKGTTATSYVPYNALCATCQEGVIRDYTNATGTVSQDGTPPPTTPLTPTIYTQGDLTLRAVTNDTIKAYDTYDASTGKITRRVGVKVFTGAEDFDTQGRTGYFYYDLSDALIGDGVSGYCSHIDRQLVTTSNSLSDKRMSIFASGGTAALNREMIIFHDSDFSGVSAFKAWLSAQYAAGTPVTVWYVLATPVEEDFSATQYCSDLIQIATTKHVTEAFSTTNTQLTTAITTVNNVVTNTIDQANRINALATNKQTRPSDAECPQYRQCLLVEDENGIPHWYQIIDPFRDLLNPILTNSVHAKLAPAGATADTSTYDSRRYKGLASWGNTYAPDYSGIRERQWTQCGGTGANANPCRTVDATHRVLNEGEWAVEYEGDEHNSLLPGGGVIYGEAKCTSVASPFATKLDSLNATQQANFWELPAPKGETDRTGFERANFKQCWCRMTGVGVDGEFTSVPSSASWVFANTHSSAANCALSCAFICARYVRESASFRNAIFDLSD